MNRAERRNDDRHRLKLIKEAQKLTPNQQNMMYELIDIKAKERQNAYKDLLNGALLEAMRENHISIKRIDKIVKETNEKMNKTIEKAKEVS